MRKILIFLFILILLIIAILGLIFVYQISICSNFEGEKEFVITQGESVDQISQNLLDQNIIKSKFTFITYIYFKRWHGSVQAGSYVLTPMNIIDLAETLVAGKVDNEITFQFIEGWTLKEMADYLLEQKFILNSNEFLNSVKLNGLPEKYSFLQNIPSQSLEGFLFPDTYRIFKDSTIDDVVIKMLDNFDAKLTSAMRTEITAQGKNLYDMLIMASIIEQEVPDEEERQIVSGILWKRLDVDMPLQVDSSLKYEIGKKDRAVLTFEELEIDSAYNTYKYKGLPPTPICNPGESAIRAAIYPKDSDYWYYLSTPKSETIFSKTLEEHNQAIKQYLK